MAQILILKQVSLSSRSVTMNFFKGFKYQLLVLSSLFAIISGSALDLLSGFGGEKNGNEDLVSQRTIK